MLSGSVPTWRYTRSSLAGSPADAPQASVVHGTDLRSIAKPVKMRPVGIVQLRVFLTGRVVIETGGVVLDERLLAGRQGRLVFAYLVSEQGRPVPRDQLAEALWGPSPPATWDKALTVIASKLRRGLTDAGVDGASALTSAFGCYRLDLPDGSWST